MPLAWHQSGLEQMARRIAQGPCPGAHAPRVSGPWPGFESRALAVTVHFRDRGISHGVFHIRLAADGIKAFCQIPALTPSRKRLKTVLHLPNSSSQSRQGLSVRTIHGMASANQAPVRASWPCIARLAQAVRGHQCPLLVAQYSSFHGGIAAQEEDSQQALNESGLCGPPADRACLDISKTGAN